MDADLFIVVALVIWRRKRGQALTPTPGLINKARDHTPACGGLSTNMRGSIYSLP
jgi:hypothetical protein